MRLGEYCRSETGFVLLPIEHLGLSGSDADLAAFLVDECGWARERVALLDEALALYWSRSASLAERTRAWPAPRIRNIGVVADAAAVRPYAQILNTSTWTLYDCDLDPDRSDPQLAAYLLVLGDWMAMTGEVTEAPVRSAAWWLDVDDEACRGFAAAAERSTRADGDAIRAVAASLDWMRTLGHRDLRPARAGGPHRDIPGSGLQVPAEVESKPPELAEACRSAALAAVEDYRRAWHGADAGPLRSLERWLASERPMVVVTAASGEIVWDPEDPAATSQLATALENADAVAVESIRHDLATTDERSRRFVAALADPGALPTPGAGLAEGGYAYMHPHRRVVAYNLDEPGMERRSGPPLPYERAMLGARVLHEWAHLADEAGWVTSTVADDDLGRLRGVLAAELEAAVEECALAVRAVAEADLADLCAGRPPGVALAELLLTRLPDYRANLVARAFMTTTERETYARHNIRTLRREYAPQKLWRMIVRYLYEYQYLLGGVGFTEIDDPYRYFALSTGFDRDVIGAGVLVEERFHAVTAALAALLAVYVVDSERIALP